MNSFMCFSFFVFMSAPVMTLAWELVLHTGFITPNWAHVVRDKDFIPDSWCHVTGSQCIDWNINSCSSNWKSNYEHRRHITAHNLERLHGHDKCLRLYDMTTCSGNSIALTVHSESLKFAKKIASIGPCYDEEEKIYDRMGCPCCDRYQRERHKECENKAWVDWPLFVGTSFPETDYSKGFTPYPSQAGPIVKYGRRTDNQRLDYIIAHVYRHHLDNGTDVDENMKSFVRRLGNDDDTAGQIISKKLGGSGSLSFNVFPQSPNFDVSRWQRVQDEVYNEAKDRIFSILEVYFIYKNDAATRPTAFVYRRAYCRNDGVHLVLYNNDMINY